MSHTLSRLPGFPTEDRFSARQRFFCWTAGILAILLKAPTLFLQPRLWAEEASLYLVYARDHGLLEGLFFIPTTTGSAGYLLLAANLPAVIAGRLLPLEWAPWVTTSMALAVHGSALAVVLFGTSHYWRTPVQRLLACALIIAGPPIFGEVWLNTINAQIFCGLSAVLLLGEDFSGASLRRRRFFRAVLIFCALSGPYTAFLAPLFLLRWYFDRHPEAGLRAAIVGGAAAFQAACFLWVSRDFALLRGHFELGPWGLRSLRVLEHYVLRPVLGRDTASWTIHGLCREVGGGPCSDSPALMGWGSFLILGLLLLGLTWPLRRRPGMLLAGSFLCLAAAVSVSTGPAQGMGRYAVLPGLVFLLLLVQGAGSGPRFRRYLCGALAAGALVVGLASYRQELLPGALGQAPGRPDWQQEVARWREDDQPPLAIWPYADSPWHVYLRSRRDPGQLRGSQAPPFRIVSVGPWTQHRLAVERWPQTFRILLDLTASGPPEQVDVELRLLDREGEVLGLAVLKDFRPGAVRQFFLGPRHFRQTSEVGEPSAAGAELRNFEAVRSIALAARSRRPLPTRVDVQRLAWSFEVEGLLEPWLPVDRTLLYLGFVMVILWAGIRLAEIRADVPPRRELLLKSLLVTLVLLPGLCFYVGLRDGAVAFVLYREPKRIAILLLGWIFLMAAAWILRPSRRELAQVLLGPIFLTWVAFMGTLALTHRQALVGENFLYEGHQYLLLTLLLLTLGVWARRDPSLPRLVCTGVAFSLALTSLVSFLQWGLEIPFLPPIDPELGTVHPSFMGYKNPMALALLGQIFLVAERALRSRASTPRRWWRLLLVAEALLLASMESRTAYLALAVGMIVLLALGLRRRPTRRNLLRVTAAAGLLGILFLSVWTFSPSARQRIASLGALLRHPGAYGETDRGTYLRNTLQMVSHQPLGVGLGDWQSWYPVYRLHNRSRAFTGTHQVRRAHSDHVQFLGEAGWGGLALWWTFLGILIYSVGRRALAGSRREFLPFDGFLAAQIVAVVVAMAGDYFLEMPFHKFLFVLLVFLALPRGIREETPPPSQQPVGGIPWIPLAVTALALLVLPRVAGEGKKIVLDATLSSELQTFASQLRTHPGAARKRAEHILELGERFQSLPGHSKTFFRQYLQLAQTAAWAGRPLKAHRWAQQALRLHPYSPDAFALMAAISREPSLARRWRDAHRFLMDEATDGYSHPLPPGHPLAQDLQ